MIVVSVLVCIYAFREDPQVSDSVKQMAHFDCPFVLFLRRVEVLHALEVLVQDICTEQVVHVIHMSDIVGVILNAG